MMPRTDWDSPQRARERAVHYTDAERAAVLDDVMQHFHARDPKRYVVELARARTLPPRVRDQLRYVVWATFSGGYGRALLELVAVGSVLWLAYTLTRPGCP